MIERVFSTPLVLGSVALELGAVDGARRRIAEDYSMPYYYGGGAIQTRDVSKLAWIAPTLNRIAREVERDLERLYDVKHAWVNASPMNGYIRPHLHYGSDLSGVVYLQCDERSGDLVFVDPRPMFRTTQAYTKMGDTRVKPSVGGYAVFPSWLEHEVEPNESSIYRISVAFDLVERM